MTNAQLVGLLVEDTEELQKVPIAQVNQILQEKAGAELLTVITRTTPSMRKKGNPYWGRVLKVAKVNGQIRFNYEKAVQRQQEKEGHEPTFEAQPRKWGSHVNPHSTFLAHITQLGEAKFYLRLRVLKSKSVFVDENGEIVPTELIEPYLTPKQDNGVTERDYNLDNILAVSIAGERYMIER